MTKQTLSQAMQKMNLNQTHRHTETFHGEQGQVEITFYERDEHKNESAIVNILGLSDMPIAAELPDKVNYYSASLIENNQIVVVAWGETGNQAVKNLYTKIALDVYRKDFDA